ncbi:molybdopterin cofactor-binding domain-containing protein [Pseudomonas sp. NPDC007930]|uniref:xanthine dehydrogenase family protein molybdopterin-binding subunit n=1 Tax=Pseudomonas sp. NPDC007930 TaxID=3364417 RepID=UPI0036E1827A
MNNTTIGHSQRRIEGRQKVTGAARYAADHPLPRMAYAYGVYSEIAHGRIQAIDAAAAQRMPGVLAVLHHGNLPGLHHSPSVFNVADPSSASRMDEHRVPFEDDQVHYPGQFVALVVAETFEQARAAAQRVRVSYASAAPVVSLDQALAAGPAQDAPRRHSRGDFNAALPGASHQVDALYSTPVETHNPMEMHATTAWWAEGKLFMYEATQGVINHRNALAAVFDLPPDRVEVRAPFIGSGFGGKLFPWPHSIAACAAARAVSRPVQLVLPRAQMFTTVGHRPETRQHLRLGANAAGQLVALGHASVNSTSVIDTYVETCGRVSESLYSCANVLVTHQSIGVHRGTPTSMRAPGAAPGLFALESAIDELAIACAMDPLAFRLLNLASRDESTGLPWSSNHLPEALKVGAERFGWAGRQAQPGAMRDGDELIGYGLGACNWDAYRIPTQARVSLRADGTALVQCGLQDIGTGTYTILAQTVSELTGLPLAKVEVELGSSAFPPGPVSGGSWVTASAMPAVADATRNALQRLASLAVAGNGVFAGLAPEQLEVSAGQLSAQGQRFSFSEVLKRQRLARAEGEAHSTGADSKTYAFRSFGAHFVEARWDPGISRLRIARVVSVIDAGRAINPLAARNQVEGAIVMGLGMALFEASEYDSRSGLPVNNNYAEYVVPVHADMPEIDVVLLDYPDYHLNEFGARGIGEIGVTGLAAAVANAVYHATGKRIRELPITLDKLMDTARA